MAAHNVEVLDTYPPLAAVASRICDEHACNLPQVSAPPGGVCYRCYASLRTLNDGRLERVVDMGVWVEMEGKILLCETCCGEIAVALGYIAPEKADELRKTNRALGSENHQLKRRVEVAMQAVADLSATITEKHGR